MIREQTLQPALDATTPTACPFSQLDGGELKVSQVYPQHGLRLGSVLSGTYTWHKEKGTKGKKGDKVKEVEVALDAKKIKAHRAVPN